jgi:hypothetical protein
MRCCSNPEIRAPGSVEGDVLAVEQHRPAVTIRFRGNGPRKFGADDP